MHPNVVPTEELKAKLLGLLKANSKFNSSNESLPVLNQHLDSALDFLLQSGREVEVYLEPNVHTSGGTRLVVNEPRPIGAAIVVDQETPVVVTIGDITAMGSEEYAKKLVNPRFKKAVDQLYQRFGR